MSILPVITALMMMVGIFLIVRGLTTPDQQPETISNRLDQYGGRPMTLEEIEMQKPFSERMVKPIMNKISKTMEQRAPQKTLETIRINLEAAGNPNDLTVSDFLGLKGFAALAVAGAALLLVSGMDQPFIIKIVAMLVAGVIGSNLPNMWLGGKISSRQQEILLSMPDALDLLTISVEAGMGFDQAMQKVSNKWDNSLTREFGKALREQRMGKSRRESLRALAERCSVQEITTFTSAIIQGEQLGVSIARILNIQSEQMRMRRRQKAEKMAHQAPLKMTIPMVMFLMPALWIVILGPMWPAVAIMMGGG